MVFTETGLWTMRIFPFIITSINKHVIYVIHSFCSNLARSRTCEIPKLKVGSPTPHLQGRKKIILLCMRMMKDMMMKCNRWIISKLMILESILRTLVWIIPLESTETGVNASFGALKWDHESTYSDSDKDSPLTCKDNLLISLTNKPLESRATLLKK